MAAKSPALKRLAKKVVGHLGEDTREFKEQIADDRKLKRAIKKTLTAPKRRDKKRP